jgi:hypothetical protein
VLDTLDSLDSLDSLMLSAVRVTDAAAVGVLCKEAHGGLIDDELWPRLYGVARFEGLSEIEDLHRRFGLGGSRDVVDYVHVVQ